LVIVGATPEGKKEFVGLADGVRESTQSWKEMLLDLRRRGLTIGPELAVADGALGFWKALEEVCALPAPPRCEPPLALAPTFSSRRRFLPRAKDSKVALAA
jgi:putative transposase